MASTHSPARSPNCIRIVLIDACELVRIGAAAALSAGRIRPITIVAEGATGAEALALCGRHKPDVLLLELELPDASGLDICRSVLAAHPHIRVLFLAHRTTPSIGNRAMLAGAHGCLGKEISPAALVDAVYDVASGGSIMDGYATRDDVTSARETRGAMADLSARQRRVLELVSDGRTNGEIAAELQLSRHTVRNYLVATFRKLGVKRRAQASAMFAQNPETRELLRA